MVFVGVMKYFRHMLMGHEIFFKIFDEPRNIFLCSISIILFLKLRKEAGAQNIQTSHQGDLKKTRHVQYITSTRQI